MPTVIDEVLEKYAQQNHIVGLDTFGQWSDLAQVEKAQICRADAVEFLDKFSESGGLPLRTDAMSWDAALLLATQLREGEPTDLAGQLRESVPMHDDDVGPVEYGDQRESLMTLQEAGIPVTVTVPQPDLVDLEGMSEVSQTMWFQHQGLASKAPDPDAARFAASRHNHCASTATASGVVRTLADAGWLKEGAEAAAGALLREDDDDQAPEPAPHEVVAQLHAAVDQSHPDHAIIAELKTHGAALDAGQRHAVAGLALTHAKTLADHLADVAEPADAGGMQDMDESGYSFDDQARGGITLTDGPGAKAMAEGLGKLGIRSSVDGVRQDVRQAAPDTDAELTGNDLLASLDVPILSGRR